MTAAFLTAITLFSVCFTALYIYRQLSDTSCSRIPPRFLELAWHSFSQQSPFEEILTGIYNCVNAPIFSYFMGLVYYISVDFAKGLLIACQTAKHNVDRILGELQITRCERDIGARWDKLFLMFKRLRRKANRVSGLNKPASCPLTWAGGFGGRHLRQAREVHAPPPLV